MIVSCHASFIDIVEGKSFQHVPTIETTMPHDHDELGVMPLALPIVSRIGSSLHESPMICHLLLQSEEPPVTDTV